VVYAALAGNVAIAVANSVAYGLSGSSAMLTEAIHSLVDSTDQILLLVGQARGRRPADAGHPLGHGMETYFWSFIVAVMVLLLGGAVSLYQGVQNLLATEAITSPAINLAGVRGAALLEARLSIAYREFKRVVRGRTSRQDLHPRLEGSSLCASPLEDRRAGRHCDRGVGGARHGRLPRLVG
jgi:divalent metal cation (Fe/Co/Zn/Cd) transporter